MKAIEDLLLYSTDRESFIQDMEYERLKEVQWSDSRKHITYTCPDGIKCQDNKLHDETSISMKIWRSCLPIVPSTALHR